MPTVVGVKLRFSSKALWFDANGIEPCEGDLVIVTTGRGTELGTVVQTAMEVEESDLPAPLKPVNRIATEEDLSHAEELEGLEAEARPIVRRMMAEHGLDMKLVDVEYVFGGDKIVIYFVAEERVDFRELVRELASRFHARIDMRQIGVRDEARMIGGIGHCGQELCCARCGGDFQPVSIRMAKEQDLPLNPLKISGVCGRLMCCLRYEFEAYKDYKSRAPKRGAILETPLGLAKVVGLDTPHETVEMALEDGKRFTVPLADMHCCKGGTCPCAVSREALEALQSKSMTQAFSVLDRDAEARLRAEEPAEQPEEQEAPSDEGGGRRRRRRRTTLQEAPADAGARSETATGAEKAAQPQQRKGQKQPPKAAQKAQPKQPQRPAKQAAQKAPKQDAEAERPDAEAASKPRRRRRRRPSAGGGNAEGTNPSA